jgi:hypothetical protein
MEEVLDVELDLYEKVEDAVYEHDYDKIIALLDEYLPVIKLEAIKRYTKDPKREVLYYDYET